VSICLQGQGGIIKTVGTHGPGGSPGTFPSCAVPHRLQPVDREAA